MSKFLLLASVLPVVLVVLFAALKTWLATDPLEFMYPNALLFTGRRAESKALWHKIIKIDESIVYDHPHVPIILAKDYSFESLRRATENFRYPAIVRGLFNNTRAQQLWTTADYLPSKLGEFRIPAVRNALVGKVQNDRVLMSFADAFKEIHSDPESKTYIFFPVKSRFNFNGSDVGSLEALQEAVNELALKDIELHRIWPGFGTKAHSTYYGTQIIIGQGSDDDEQTTGTGWHCAIGNNWFVQVAGAKRWYFLDPKYSSNMFPLRGGKVNMMTGTPNMGHLQKFLPLRYGDVLAGDLLYNPDWEWHTIKNYKGMSIGCPIREANMSLSFQNNFQYSSIVYLNKIAEKFGIDIGGYAPTN